MNKARREELRRAAQLINEATGIIEGCTDDEQEYFDAMPEGIQSSQKGDDAQTAIDALESASSSAAEAESYLNEIIGVGP